MQHLKLVISNNAPNINGAVWAKPVEGGYALYILSNGMWKPLKFVDDKGTPSTSDDTVVSIVDSITESETPGAIKVGNKDVQVAGLGTAAFNDIEVYSVGDGTYGLKFSSSVDTFEPLEESTI